MSNKAVLVAMLAVLGSAPAFAGASAPAKKPAPTKKINVGASYTVGKETGKKSLTEEQVNEVVKSKLGEVETCWHQLPEDKRKSDVKALLRLEIDDRGEVQTAEVNGPVPDETQRCIAMAASEWEFPATDVKADAAYYEYPLAFHAK